MVGFKLERYAWERSSLYLRFSGEQPFEAGDSLVLDGTMHDPIINKTPVAKRLQMDGVYREGEHALRVRFLIGDGGYPVMPGEYKAFIRRNGVDYPIVASEEVVHPTSASLRRQDILLDIRVYAYYKVVPTVSAGALGFAVDARKMPESWENRLKQDYGLAKREMRRALINLLSVKVYGFFRRHCKQRPNKVLFTSDSRTGLSGNMEPLFKRMQERGVADGCEIVFSFNSRPHASRSPKSYLSLAYHVATARVIFCDDHQPFLYHVDYRPGTRLVQLWHACGHFKTVGGGRIGTLDAPNPFSVDHRTYTDVIVAADSDVPIYGEAFSIPDECVKPYGIPRHDVLLDGTWQQRKRAEFEEAFPAAAGKRVVLFAPTFRGAGKKSAYYDYARIDFDALLEHCRREGLFFIFKMHPFVPDKPALPDGSEDVFADGSAIREINDLLPSTDVLVTDYSSVVYEAALLDIPTIYFAFDLEEYVGSRDFYEPYEDFASGPIVRDFADLLDAMANPDAGRDKLAAFKVKNFKYLDGKSCDRIIDNIVLPALEGGRE